MRAAKNQLIDESQATGPVKAVFEEIKATLQVPFVPQVFRALALDPPRLTATWDRLRAVLLTGPLDFQTKVLVALAVAEAQRSAYFTSAYTAVLKRLGMPSAELEDLRRVVELAVELDAYAADLKLEPDLR